MSGILKEKTQFTFKILSLFFTWVILFSLLLTGIGQAEENSDGKKRFGVKLTGGMSYLVLGDTKKFQEGMIGYYEKCVSQKGCHIVGEYEKMDWGSDLEADILVYLTSRFGLSIGTGRIFGNKENRLTISGSAGSSLETANIKVSAVPIRLGAFYSLPLFSKAKICFQAGAGYYFARWSKERSSQKTCEPIYWYSGKDNARSKGVGFHGGIGFEYNVTSRIAFFIEGLSRHVKIRKFKGEADLRDSTGFELQIDEGEGTLYYYYSEVDNGSYWVPFLEVLDREPVYPFTRSVKEAVWTSLALVSEPE